jgi:hypothetical protein
MIGWPLKVGAIRAVDATARRRLAINRLNIQIPGEKANKRRKLV